MKKVTIILSILIAFWIVMMSRTNSVQAGCWYAPQCPAPAGQCTTGFWLVGCDPVIWTSCCSPIGGGDPGLGGSTPYVPPPPGPGVDPRCQESCGYDGCGCPNPGPQCKPQYEPCGSDSECCSPFICKAGRCDGACSYVYPDKPDLTAPPNNSTSDQTTVLLQWSFTNGWGNSCVGTNNQFKIYTRPSPSGNWSVPATWPAASPVPRPFPTASCSPTVGLLTVPINLTPLSVKSLSLNWGGLQEKWFVDKNKSDYYIFPLANRAKVYKWQNGLQAGSGSPKGDKLITDTETLDCYNNIRGGSLPTAYGLPFTGSVGSTYDWRVRAVNGGGGTDSNIWSFTISGTPPPLASWWQASSGDVTAKGDIQSAIPNGQYLITNPPGVAVAGGNISLNNQPASSVGWKVASSQLSSGLATDYNFTYLKSRIKTVVDPASITTPVTSLSQLTPATGLVDGVYYVYSSGNIDVTGNLDIGNNKIVWVAEGGDVNLKSKINLNDGQGVLVIMAEKNINIDPTVGTTPLVDPATLTPHLEGIFIAGGLVNTGNGNNQLRIDGSVVGLSGVSLLRQQTSAYPAEYFVFRPDLIVNLPKPLLRTNRLWQEVAP